ncbi:unnamed protein product [Candidula unifasciata]|uniref:Uncharacterized protein n=1 Tax=Candidula unifasciata TaxID=100452 RepID=A0A8S4A4C5_9EUPU|nr:unnamed protein product [Candidula unifasciata]
MRLKKCTNLTEALMLIPMLFLMCSASKNSSCPAQCKCTQEQLTDMGLIYNINCNRKGLLVVPDLTILTEIRLPIYLNFGSNKITSVSTIDFPPDLNIFRLDLDHNMDMNIEDDTFINLAPTLKKLSVEAVGLIFNRPLEMVSSLEKLEELSISHNNKIGYVTNAVKDVEAVLFQSEWPVSKSMKILRMSHCSIRSLSPASLDSLISLTELDLSNNWLTSVPSVIRHLKDLRKISLFRCQISVLEDYSFLGLSKLEVIELTTNPLTTIENNAFIGLENCLKRLQLELCHLRDIPSQAIKDLTKLEYLDLSQNSFSVATDTSFTGKYCLKELLVSAEGMRFEPHAFSGQKHCVTDLTIKSMKLQTVPREAIAEIEKLARLSLEFNNITVLPREAFRGIKATSINLANNKLKHIDPGAFLGLPPHLHLNLRRTAVSDIDFLLGYPDDAIDTVNLDYAELECRCSMKSALNATLSVEIYGSCTKGQYVVPLSSSRLEGILDTVCLEEQALNDGYTAAFRSVLYGFCFILCVLQL